MATIPWITLGALLSVGSLSLAAAPEVEIASNSLRARVYLPDAGSGFYRGTRFDWSGVIGSLVYAGHEFYPAWFQRTDAGVHDFTYEGPDIVAGPCTAITGPAEEFVFQGKALGFEEAKPGGTFLKIGVGVLRRPDDRAYDPFRRYEIVEGGTWRVAPRPESVEFEQVLEDATTGYAYQYRKSVSLVGDGSRMVLDHRLRNTGRRTIQTSVYNHNFLHLDRRAPGPDFTLTFPFPVRAAGSTPAGLAVVQGNQVTFAKVLAGEERVYLGIEGFGADPKDHDIRLENRALGVGVRITGDRPLSRLALWAIRAPLSIEPFIDMTIPPGEAFTWQTRYEYYRIPNTGK